MSDLQSCYRHPDRRSGVICQRCDRPICPDCMQQASVGFHCPECTKTTGQRVVRANQRSSTTVVTSALIAANVAVFVYGMLAHDGDWVTTPPQIRFDGGLARVLVEDGEWYRIVTSGFLHFNLIHIALNCFALYQLGQLMEPVLGRLRFALTYFVAMFAGSLGVLLVDQRGITVGASGAVFGLMGAAVAAMRSRGINPMATSLGTTIMLNLVITFGIPGISIGGHVGGLIGGFLAGWLLLDYGPKASRNPQVPVAMVVGLGVALVAACLVVPSALA